MMSSLCASASMSKSLHSLSYQQILNMRILEKKRIGAPKCKKNISFTYYRKIHKLRVNYKLMLCNGCIRKRISCSCERKSCRRGREVADVTEKVADVTEKVADVTEKISDVT